MSSAAVQEAAAIIRREGERVRRLAWTLVQRIDDPVLADEVRATLQKELVQ